jgi:hypothetical protein
MAGSTEEERMLARDALMNNLQRLLETGKPVAMKVARRVWEGAGGKGLTLVSTSLAAYFIRTLPKPWRSSFADRNVRSKRRYKVAQAKHVLLRGQQDLKRLHKSVVLVIANV